MPEKRVFQALNLLVSLKMADKVKKEDGWHCELRFAHPIFTVQKKAETLADYNPVASESVTTFQIQQVWSSQFLEIFKQPYVKDQKDLVRFRFVLRKQGGKKALQAITEFLTSKKNAPHKATSLGFYCAYGRSKAAR